jgi:hypothetical protein
MEPAANIRQKLSGASAQEKLLHDNHEGKEKLDLLKIRCISIVNILKKELEMTSNNAPYLIYTWYTENVNTAQLKSSQHLIDLRKCINDFTSLLQAIIKISSDFHQRVEKLKSLDEFYDLLQSSFSAMKHYRDNNIKLSKNQFIRIDYSGNNKEVDERLKTTPIYTYLTRILESYREMLDLIRPAIDEKHISYWLDTTIIITDKDERISKEPFNIIYKTSLSNPSTVFNRECKELEEHICQVLKEHP